MPVVGHAGRVDQARLDGRVPSDVAAAVEALPQHDVIDQLRVDAGPSNGLGHDVRAHLEGVDVEERAPERGTDGSARRRDDDRFMHGGTLL